MVQVVYKMIYKTTHEVMFDSMLEARNFKFTLNNYIRRAIVTDFKMLKLAKLVEDTSGVLAI